MNHTPALLGLLALFACGENGGEPSAPGTSGSGGAGGASSSGSGGASSSSGAGGSSGGDTVNELSPDMTLALPDKGSFSLRILTPTVLEVTAITTKGPDPAPLSGWNFDVPPPASEFVVTAGGAGIAVTSVSLNRRVLYAPMKKQDLRIRNELSLTLATPLAAGQTATVTNPDASLWPANVTLSRALDPMRLSAVVHVNQTGYEVGFSKHARVGRWLGTGGELPAPADTKFELVSTKDGAVAFEGSLTPHPEAPEGWTLSPYENVMDADFTAFDAPGNYRLVVPGLGASYPFFITRGAAAAFARTYALGLYHQRCGVESALPFTRFTRGACHTAAAQIPTTAPEFDSANALIQSNSGLANVDASLYPFVDSGSIDVSGGHHDAGDYSKYTINSAHLIHTLVFAADSLPGTGALDNLGVPESGDGKSDLLEEAEWEADFLAKMQDADGGFFTLVYPKNRAYEDDVTPDHGDPQIVWPKTTAVTAAAVAALAQIGSSPLYRKVFSAQKADQYLAKAKKGWQFLKDAIAAHGQDGSYQKFYAYGDAFGHKDELSWAAAELYLATGDVEYSDRLKAWFPDPSDPATITWGWWRLSESYGNAIRSYAFGARSGRIDASKLDAAYVAKCEEQIALAADDQRRWAAHDAYGTSFPEPSKAFKTAGWYFSVNQAFDVVAAHVLAPKPELLDALVSNMNFEGGTNPADVSFLEGLGWRRQHEIVSQQGENDREALPPSGIVAGNVIGGLMQLGAYGTDLNKLSLPGDTCPFYDRWADSFNVMAESVSLNEARGLAATAYLMAMTSVKDQAWRAAPGTIDGVPSTAHVGDALTLELTVPGMNVGGARLVWEVNGAQPVLGGSLSWKPAAAGPQWVEVEAQWPDGRRAFATKDFVAVP